jgi:ubiquitin-conjugating enzyme E2 T
LTRIYHPNIDEGGRICADILKTGEKGGWNPAINLATALLSLRQLIATPNPDDPLEIDIAQEYKLDYPTFELKAKEFTKKYASEQDVLNDNVSCVSFVCRV